jgi:formylglycine-generating enzyme required for sulfatase activity
LPTEAEWEYAARGGRRTRGELYAGSHEPGLVAWLDSDSLWSEHAPVASKRPNALGLYDMSGGVWEWCSDIYAPHSLIGRRFRVIRGGGYRGPASYARVSNRYQFAEWRKEPTVGFRLAM